MTLDQLRIFVAVAERQHLTQAAAALHLTPSAVSSAIRALESRHGLQLFHRVGRGIELTEAGAIFLGEAQAILARTEAAELIFSELGGLKRGSIVIHASQTIASYWLPPILVRFHERHPTIDIRLTVGNTRTVTDSVLEGLADLGFIEGEIDEPRLASRTVAQDQLIIVVRPYHPWAAMAELPAAELTSKPWVIREKGSGTRSAFESALRQRGVDPEKLPIVLELPSNEAILSAVQSWPVAGALSELVTRPHLETGRLIRLPFAVPPRSFAVLRHKERYRTKAALALEAMLAEPHG